MRLLDWVSSGRAIVGNGMQDSRHAVAWMRHTLRGNRNPPSTSWESADKPTPVLLLHGYLATRGSLHVLARRLTERGHYVVTYRLGLLNTGHIEESASLIAAQVEAIAASTGSDKVDIVAHSMGGLVGLQYIKRLGGRRRVRRMILLGTPVSGTWSALLGLPMAALGPASRQMLPASGFLRDLEEARLPDGVEIVSIAGDRDFLAPSRSTRIKGIHAVSLPTNHAGLLVDRKVADLVGEILDESSDSLDSLLHTAAHRR